MTIYHDFKAYIRSRRVTDTPNGTFVYDARRDTRFPDGIHDWHTLEQHLWSWNACEEAFQAGREWMRRYRAQKAAGFG